MKPKTTTKAAHTQGPWEVCPGTGVVYRAERYSRADVVVKSVEGYDLSGRPDADRRDANARLIASAPDLLTALINLMGAIDPGGVTDEALDIARAAIRKAEGK